MFTHIAEQRQDAWLTELQRIVRPDGLLILSTHGEVALEAGGFPIREQLEDEGIVFIDKLARTSTARRSQPRGPVGGLARRAVLRAVRPYSAHQDEFDAAAAQRIVDLEARVAQLENRR